MNSPLLSIVIPAHNEAGSLPETLRVILAATDAAHIPVEIVVVNDHSSDATAQVARQLASQDQRIRPVDNTYSRGYGYTVRRGLEVFSGEVVIITMADLSDDPADLVAYYQEFLKGYDCVFGTRFCRNARVTGYPWHKLVLNRIGNCFIQALFFLPYNDVTNAFKCYSRKAIDGMVPFISRHFNLTVEMPLKAIIRGYTWRVIPTNWYGRAKGVSKWNIKEMGSRYLFIILYLWLERLLSRNDYRKEPQK